MRIGSEPLFPRKGSVLEEIQKRLAESLERLSTTMRINRAADDAGGLAISESMRAQIGETLTQMRNIQDRISMIQVADQALGSQSEIIDRMRELAVQATNATLSEEDRGAIEKEFNQLKEEINRIAENTLFNERPVIEDMNADKLGLSNVRLGDESALRALDRAREMITSRRTNLGAEQRGLASEIGRLGIAAVNLTAAESLIRDTDIAQEVSKLAVNQILHQTSLLTLNQVNNLSSQVLLYLLRGI